ncbi:hypothetical protein ACOMHN_035468 [Nucella lapillus]
MEDTGPILTEEPAMASSTTMELAQTLSTASLFLDLKLKRRRVLDLLADSESARLHYIMEGPESDQQSEISTADSAYVSDRGSECGTAISGEEFPIMRGYACDSKVGDSSNDVKERESVPSMMGKETNSPNVPPPAMTYMPGYWMPMSADFPHMMSLAPNGVRFIPFMSMTGQMFSSLNNGMMAPMFLPAQQNRYFFPNPGMTHPSMNSLHQTSLQQTAGKTVDGGDFEPQTSSKNTESSMDENRLEKNCRFVTHYTSGTFPYTGHLVANSHNRGHPTSRYPEEAEEESDEEEVMVCAICCDRATGLHYGIVTCEGCKGFFKRTVQNKRVYTCTADGDCEINKLQRNRCQYCRFRKCLEMGMVMAAVREDRMPGGRNSGAIYNLYKMKYKCRKLKKSKSTAKHCTTKQPPSLQPATCFNPHFNNPFLFSSCPSELPPYYVQPPGGCYESDDPNAASSSQSDRFSVADSGIEDDQNGSDVSVRNEPSSSAMYTDHGKFQEDCVVRSPYTVYNPNSTRSVSKSSPVPTNSKRSVSKSSPVPSNSTRSVSTKPSPVPYSALIAELVHGDSLLSVAEDYKMEQLVGPGLSMAKTMCKVGDDVMLRLVQWIRQLPFHADLPLPLQTQLLSTRWHQLLLLVTAAYGTIQQGQGPSDDEPSCAEMYQRLVTRLGQTLSKTSGRAVTVDELYREVGVVMERVCRVVMTFQQLGVTRRELAILQVILLLQAEDDNTETDPAVQHVTQTYQEALRHSTLEGFPSEAHRFRDLLAQLSEIRTVSRYLLHTRLVFVPFLINT